jgi:hypothetical protein
MAESSTAETILNYWPGAARTLDSITSNSRKWLRQFLARMTDNA